MATENTSNEKRSKFTPTGNEQGSAAVQSGGHPVDKESDTNREKLEDEEQRTSQGSQSEDSVEQDPTDGQKDEERGIFSALVGDGKEP